MSLDQDYIDNTLYEIQCCFGNMVGDIANQEYIGIDCTEKKDKVRLLKAILRVLVRNRPEFEGEERKEKCLTDEEINDIIEKAKEICRKCCIDYISI